MPTYVYACKSCGHQFEQYQSFSDDALTVCPECEGQLRKVFNSVGLVFKGSGFYVTDKGGSGSSAAQQSAPAAESTGTESTSTESTSTESTSAPAGATSTAPAASGSAPSGSAGTSGSAAA